MMRSLFSGVSGLKNHQTRMDVIGNNISNVNTAGFKGSRVVFQDMLSQTIQSASSPQGNRGGTNPQQVGLGVGIGSIDTIYSDGNVQSTGKNTDLCISGNGFFIVSDGANKIYSRAGAFEFDEEGNYVIPGSGLKVQGWMADANGNISSNGEPTGIQIPKGQTIPAQATNSLTYTKNLSSDAKETETVRTTAPDSMVTEVLPGLGTTRTVNEDGSIEEKEVRYAAGGTNTRIIKTTTISTAGVKKIVLETWTDNSGLKYVDFNNTGATVTSAQNALPNLINALSNDPDFANVINPTLPGPPVTPNPDFDQDILDAWNSFQTAVVGMTGSVQPINPMPPANKTDVETSYN